MKSKMKHSFLKSIIVTVVMLALAFPLSVTSFGAAEEKYPPGRNGVRNTLLISRSGGAITVQRRSSTWA
jgi:hypothetical protein